MPRLTALVALLACGAALLLVPAAWSAPDARPTQNSKLKTQNPAQWEPNTRVSQGPPEVGQNETAIAVNPLNSDDAVAVSKDYSNGINNVVFTTIDGGATWLEQPFPLPDPTLPSAIDPTVFFRRDGRPYLVWTAYIDFYRSALLTAWSDDGGLTWTHTVLVTPVGNYFDDKPWLAFDETGGTRDGTIYVHFTRFGSAQTMGTRSTDGGATWLQPNQISSGEFAINNDGPQPAVLPDGTVATIFIHDISAEEGQIVLSKSTDGGATWSPGSVVVNVQKPPFRLPGENWRIFTYHSFARDPATGAFNVVWPDSRNIATNGLDILTTRSTDDGATWSAPTRLNDDPAGVVRDQMFPAITAASDGHIAAIWLDRRDDPGNRLYNAYTRESTDGGATWLPSLRVSSAASDPNVKAPNADGIGDYIGIGAGPGVLWGSWVDTRNGHQEIYAARERFTPQPTPTRTATRTPTATPPGTLTPTKTVTPCPVTFTDVQVSDYFYEAVRYLSCAGVVSGYTDNTFRPYANTTRGQLSKIVVLAEGFPISTSGGPHFTDVPTSNTFYPYIETAYNRGIISGYSDRTFRWGNNVTRGQLCKIVVQAESWPIDTTGGPHFSDVPVSDTFYPYIETALNRRVVSGYANGNFRPANPATRAQISKIVYEAVRSH